MSKYSKEFMQLGINISRYRKFRGLTQEQLADIIPMSRSYLSHIEAPKMVRPFSIELLFQIASALEIEPKLLFEFHE